MTGGGILRVLIMEAIKHLQAELKSYGKPMQAWYREVYLFSDHWKELRLQAFAKHGRYCHGCKSEQRLDVHHLRYRDIFDVAVDDLQILCRECHEKEHAPYKTKSNATPKRNRKRGRKKIRSGTSEHVISVIMATYPNDARGSSNGLRNRAINKAMRANKHLPAIERLKLKSLKTGKGGRLAKMELKRMTHSNPQETSL